MHFRHNAFSRDQIESTVVPHSRTICKTILGSSATATGLDFLHLNLLYCHGMDVILMHWCVFDCYIMQLNESCSILTWRCTHATEQLLSALYFEEYLDVIAFLSIKYWNVKHWWLNNNDTIEKEWTKFKGKKKGENWRQCTIIRTYTTINV